MNRPSLPPEGDIPSVRILGGFVVRKLGWRLTARGWLLLMMTGILTGWVLFHRLYPFFAVTERVDGDVLVLEGWVPDYELPSVRAEFARSGAKVLFITGGPLLNGEPLSEYKNYADLTRSVLVRSGFSASQLVAIPSGEAMSDRTFASARALRNWFEAHHRTVRALNLITRGCHSRRSRLLFSKAFEGQVRVGVIALKDGRYDESRWWKTSEGAKDVIEEAIGYVYARFFFSPRHAAS